MVYLVLGSRIDYLYGDRWIFFMFRKFLKALPKQDGKSDLDWQEFYLDKTIHLWGQPEKELLYELVSPVPELFRQVAKEKNSWQNWRACIRRKSGCH